MASFNKVILMGNLTRDPEVRYTPSGTAVTDIGLAINRVWFNKQTNSKQEETTFVDVTLWGRQAEVAGEYLSKGRAVLIEGRLQLDQWDDKETGQRRNKLRVVGENMTMVGGRTEGGPPQRSGGYPPQQSGGGHAPSPPGDSYDANSFYDSPPDSGPPSQSPDDEVPF